MSEENNTETYLCISENKFEIYLFDKIKLKIYLVMKFNRY